MADFVIQAAAFAAIALGGAVLYTWLYHRVAGTELFLPLTVLFGSIALTAVAHVGQSMASLQGDGELATAFGRSAYVASGFQIPGFVHLVCRFPRLLSSKIAGPVVGANYLAGAAMLILVPTGFGMSAIATADGGSYLAFTAASEPFNSLQIAALFGAMVWLFKLAVRGTSSGERNSARGLLLAAGIPTVVAAPVLVLGWPVTPPFDPITLGTAWWIGVVFAVVSSGRLQFRVPPTLDAVLNSVYDAILVVDRDRNVFYANRASERLLGTRGRQTLAASIGDVLKQAATDAQGSRSVTASLDNVLAGTERSNSTELRAVGARGRTCRVDIVPLGEPTPSAGASAALLVFSDQTERVELEESNLRVRQLQDLVIRVLGHDLKAPIAVVQGNVELTEMRLAKPPLEGQMGEIRRGLQRIREATVGMLVVLENARAVSRLAGTNQAAIKLEERDLSRIASSVIELLRPAAGGHGLRLEVDVPQGIHANVLPGFESVIQNLLDNAIKYTPAGGTVGVRLYSDAAHVAIEVWDTGPGIPADKRDKLFRKFERLGAERGAVEGHGLGLSIVAKVVELSGGMVSAGDREDGSAGAVFTVVLPAAPPHIHVAVASAEKGRLQG